MKYRFENVSKDMAYRLQMMARHRQIENLLKDILVDMTVCKIEGFDIKEYPIMLKQEIDRIVNKFENKDLLR